ncbi:MAG: TlpA family protein disulfide reductase [Thermanaeromonas sp.]|uniref:TlpA family protein disulfide reductase n=1 Tax=Thermanaeromonas sp. TaxID=2003697 RepID=UPI0024406D2E|nr:TlpA disulfide reductase family protein [Thermanaeromonas sp.]MCG0279029.1 TlpA family protein disulfide reductase [Thermanaeromonas sp.]
MRRNVGLVVSVIVIFLFLAGAGGFFLWRSDREAGGDAGSTSGSLVDQKPTGRPEAGKVEVRPEVGYLAPDFTLPDMQGRTVALSQLKGKPVFLNFWATWCPPCRAEMPEIQEFFEKYRGEVEVLAVNLISSERSLEEVKKFLQTNGYTFPVVLDTEDVATKLYLVRAIPTSYLVDAQGVIRLKYTGPLTLELLERALEEVKK